MMPGLQVARHASFSYDLIGYNVRPGRLFSDGGLRAAMEYCLDKEAIVDAATSGQAQAVYSSVPPASWAYLDVSGPGRSVGVAKGLVEASGWQLAEDGWYYKDSKRLSFEVLLRDDNEGDTDFFNRVRLKFAELAKWSLKRCGIDMQIRRVTFDDQQTLMSRQGDPALRDEDKVDASLYGWVMEADPADEMWHSRQTPERSTDPESAPNWMGFVDERVDRLVDEGIAAYSREQREPIYRELQQIVAQERPVMFLYSYDWQEVITADLRIGDEAIDTRDRVSPMWWWRLEDLRVDRDR